MRSLLLSPLLAFGLFSSVLATSQADLGGRIEAHEAALAVPQLKARQLEGGADSAATTDGGAGEGTTFNGQKVPAMTELSGKDSDEQIAKGYWSVEFFSPYCHHCKAFAPTWQTSYEFYYTSDPLPASADSTDPQASLNSFTRYYDFKFAKVDCVVNADACSAHSIHSFPTIVSFKDGEKVKDNVGARDIKFMSKWVEETLETIRPGSRPAEGVKSPKAGADHSEGGKPAVSEEKDKDVAAGVLAGEKQNELATGTATATGTKSTLTATRVPQAKPTPNPMGKSVPLTAESFQHLVTTTSDPWFVKFYAPWCGHCQAMAPNWQGMARDMRNRSNIGEVNCDVEKRSCKDVRVKGYPTLLFFRGGERIEYDGLRGVGDLISFANKAVAVGDGVVDITAAEFEAMEKTEEVIFSYFYDHATTSEDFEASERSVLSLIGHAKLVKTSDPESCKRFKISTWPRLLVSRDGKPTYYTPLSPRDMRDFRKVSGWMQRNWSPIVPELTASNAREIMDGKLVVSGILSRDRADEFVIAKREIKNAALEWIDKQTQAFQLERQELRDAKQLRIEEAEDRNDQRASRSAKSIRINMDDIERKEVGFAWVDGVFWEKWIKTTYGISVRDGEKVIINDEDNRRYWDNTITGNPIVPSRTSILETLPKIVASPPKISPKSTGSAIGQFFFKSRSSFSSHPISSSGVVIGIIIGVGMWGRGQIRKGKGFGNTGSFFQLDGEKGALLGGNVGGAKAD